jgi:hypothetical protein
VSILTYKLCPLESGALLLDFDFDEFLITTCLGAVIIGYYLHYDNFSHRLQTLGLKASLRNDAGRHQLPAKI